MACRYFCPQGVRGDASRRVALEPKGVGDRLSEQRIPQGSEDEPEGAFGHMMLFMAHLQLGHEAADRIEDRVERVAVSGQDHPGGEGAGTLPVERIECAVDDLAHILFARSRTFDRLGNAAGHAIGDR